MSPQASRDLLLRRHGSSVTTGGQLNVGDVSHAVSLVLGDLERQCNITMRAADSGEFCLLANLTFLLHGSVTLDDYSSGLSYPFCRTYVMMEPLHRVVVRAVLLSIHQALRSVPRTH